MGVLSLTSEYISLHKSACERWSGRLVADLRPFEDQDRLQLPSLGICTAKHTMEDPL